ncbi:prostaglandin E synthase isoform X1 [Prionailurus viverrinus]|uniref:prostaglandin E synthase isoform X1 n=2 Tax=Prionailurus viverrinus TaxID=61388 RepID=UPI001FF1583B|nr:prostaglandin E synthase isoform X1 [Prionailurus viverrinus]
MAQFSCPTPVLTRGDRYQSCRPPADVPPGVCLCHTHTHTHTHPPRRQALPDAPMLQMRRQTRTRLRICQGRGVWGRRLNRGHSSALRLPQHLAAESGRVLCADRPPGGLSPPPPARRDTATRACCGRLPQSSRLPMEMPAPVLALVRGQALPAFLLCSTLLVIKMYVVAIITGQVRLRKKAFANPEDALRHGGLQYCRSDQDVDRCLRAHRNDMETIYPFLFLGFVYSFLGPDPFIARMHFLVFFLGRVVHTVAYLGKLRAPTRSLAYTLAQLPCASMAFQIVWEAACHL